MSNYSGKLQQLLSLLTCILLVMAISIRRDGKVVGRELKQQQTDSTKTEIMVVLEDGSVRLNTTELGKDIIGYGGTVPLEITLENGKIKSVKALENSETPDFFKEASALLTKWNGHTVEEMYNSYYNLLPLGAVDNMPQIKPIPRDEKHLDSVDLNYKNNTEDVIINIFLVNRENKKKIILIYSRLIASGVYLDINYDYDMNTHKLINDITFHGENVPNVDDEKKQTRELLEKHNISKEYLQKKSDELLDTVLTDWQRYNRSSYSRSNMGRLTIEKDEFLG